MCSVEDKAVQRVIIQGNYSMIAIRRLVFAFADAYIFRLCGESILDREQRPRVSSWTDICDKDFVLFQTQSKMKQKRAAWSVCTLLLMNFESLWRLLQNPSWQDSVCPTDLWYIIYIFSHLLLLLHYINNVIIIITFVISSAVADVTSLASSTFLNCTKQSTVTETDGEKQSDSDNVGVMYSNVIGINNLKLPVITIATLTICLNCSWMDAKTRMWEAQFNKIHVEL